MTVIFASKLYKIPRMTLYDHINGRRRVKSRTMGRNMDLSFAVKKKLTKLLKVMYKYSHGLSQIEVMTLVSIYINENK